MIVKKHLNEGRLVLAICDNNLIGKKIEEGKLQLDLTSEFYKGEDMSEEELKTIIKKAYMINVVGKKIIDFLIKNKNIDIDDIIFIKKVPHAQVVMIETKD
jgi:hypothetical protein|tara:strand:- start:285 stop:587 length:303 start_codon:yes stop_codon:yes gene_type:complete